MRSFLSSEVSVHSLKPQARPVGCSNNTIFNLFHHQVELAHVQGANLAVTLDRCFASQSGDPADPVSTKHILIADRLVTWWRVCVKILRSCSTFEHDVAQACRT